MSQEEAVFRRCARRLVPLMILIYTLGWLDRVNVGFAALTMNRDLSFSPTVFGLGAGAFFLGYFFLQVPGNVAFARMGAKSWMFWSMLAWGAISAATAFVQGPKTFYLLRILLGAAEAGFFPGLIYYLTLWFPQRRRARVTASFMAAIPLATIIGAPLSTFILEMDGLAGLHGWQWLFVLEGLPACAVALACLGLLPNGPPDAHWLNDTERQTIASALLADSPAAASQPWTALSAKRVAALSFVSLALGFTGYGISLWLPQILQSMGYSNGAIGLMVAALSLLGMAAMIVWGRSSDRRGERIWHVAIPMLLAAAGFVLVSVTQATILSIVAFACIVVGFLAADGPFFALPSSFLRGTSAAAGIAFINAIGSLGAFAGPSLVGLVRQRTGGYAAAMDMLAVILVLGAVMVSTLSLRAVSASADIEKNVRT